VKTFFSTFAAILASAIVIFSVFAAKSRLDKWENAKAACLVEIRLADSEINWSETTETEAMYRRNRAKRDLVSILKHKPFWLPLTKLERTMLQNYKSDLEAVSAARASEAQQSNDNKTPRLAPEGIVYTTVRLSVRLKTGLIGIEPGTELKVINKNPDGSLHVQSGNLVTDVRVTDVTNDLDVVDAIQNRQ